jgi:hypothetical protein
MKQKKGLLFFVVLVLLLNACSSTKVGEIQFPKIDRIPPVQGMPIERLTKMPVYDPENENRWQVDLRSKNLSQLDLTSTTLETLQHADFDTDTIWPAEKMPTGFNPDIVMETAKNPGLGMRALHAQGIDGRGIGIAIVDQSLMVDHLEYKDQLRLYEEGEDVVDGWEQTSMHGPSVTSIAVGKTIGVAPMADLYFIASGYCNRTMDQTWDFSCLAKDVLRLVEINQTLPEDRKIRAMSLAIRWAPEQDGYKEIVAAVEAAKKAGIFVISSSLEETYGFKFHGLGRDILADPDQFESYQPGSWWAKDFYEGNRFTDRLLVPMDARTMAWMNGQDAYAFYGVGGWSLSIPYIAGMYALAAQVYPEITPEVFWELAMRTGRTITLDHGGEQIPFGPILDPQALIAVLQEE